MKQDVFDLHLSPETLLQLAPGVRTRLDAAGHVLVDAPDGTVIDLGPRGFATLSLFSRPLALGHAIDRLEARERSPTDFLPTLSVINMLMRKAHSFGRARVGVRRAATCEPAEQRMRLPDPAARGNLG